MRTVEHTQSLQMLLTVALSPILYWCTSVSISSVGLLEMRPPSKNRPIERKYVGAAPLDRAAFHTYVSKTEVTLKDFHKLNWQ